MRVFWLFLGWVMCGSTLLAQDTYWVYFTDKPAWEASTPALGPDALERRAKQGIPLDARDFPVSPTYQARLGPRTTSMGHSSRWLNAQVAQLSPDQVEQVRQLPFVKLVQPVRGLARPAALMDDICYDNVTPDAHLRQLRMIGIDQLHQGGLKGEGVLVAVFDNGYRGVDTLSAFRPIFDQNRMLKGQDFVDNDTDVYAACSHCRHGTWIFSILAGQSADNLLGAAPAARYLLMRTENDDAETPQEEDNWVAAAEYADSMGAAVFTTSLGYGDFDGSADDYERADLNGDVTTITRAADIAASRGIVVVNSAGNAGNQGITAPSDGDSVLAVGSVNACEQLSSFSSRGPTADGRIKPDLSAMGEGTFILTPSGRLAQANGTSLSAPLVSGLAALLVQRYPTRPGWEIAEALRETAHQALRPDNGMGYGIPDGVKAIQYLAQGSAPATTLLVSPNPAEGAFRIYLPREISTPEVQLVNAMGQVVSVSVRSLSERNLELTPPPTTAAGVYTVLLRDSRLRGIIYRSKVVIR